MNLTNLIDVLANRKLHGRIDFRGLKISIENRAGSVRRGVDKNGKPWATKLTYPYGYILGTEGVDGDHVDCFIGPNKESNRIFIVHRQDPDTKVYDEDKCMLGFNSAQDAKKAFNDNYDRLGNFGGMTVMSLNSFRAKVLATRNNPQKLAAGGVGSGRHKTTWATNEEKEQFLSGDCHSYTTALRQLTGKPAMVVEVRNADKYDVDSIAHSMIYLSGIGQDAKFLDISGIVTGKDIKERYNDYDPKDLHIRPDTNYDAKKASYQGTVDEALPIAKKQLESLGIPRKTINAGGVGSGRHKVFYHVTDKENLTSILKYGLRPSKGEYTPGPKGVYLTSSKSRAIDYGANDKDNIILKVILDKNHKLHNDPWDGNAVFSKESIPANRITHVKEVK